MFSLLFEDDRKYGKTHPPHNVADLHEHTNLTVYHMSQSMHPPQKKCVTKLTEILFY